MILSWRLVDTDFVSRGEFYRVNLILYILFLWKGRFKGCWGNMSKQLWYPEKYLQLSPYCKHLRNIKSRCTSEEKWPPLDSINGKRWTGDKNKVDMLQLWPGWHPTTKKDTTHKVPFKQNPKANKPPPPKGLSERFSRELALTHVPEVSLSWK